MEKIKEKDFLKDPQPGRWKLENGFYVKVEEKEVVRSEKLEVKDGADKKSSADPLRSRDSEASDNKAEAS